MNRHRRPAPVGRHAAVLLILGLLPGFSAPAEAQGKACGLATPEELRAALGASVSGLKSQGAAGADMCVGQTPTATVVLRLAKGPAPQGAEAAGIEIAKKLGAQVDVRTDGTTTCSTMIPPKNLEQYGFNTTCAVTRAGQVAAIEVTAKSQKDMVSMDALRKVVDRMAGRF